MHVRQFTIATCDHTVELLASMAETVRAMPVTVEISHVHGPGRVTVFLQGPDREAVKRAKKKVTKVMKRHGMIYLAGVM